MRSTLIDRSHNRGMPVSRHCPCPGQGRGYQSHPWIQTFRGVSDIILIRGNLITMDDGFMIFSPCPLSVGWGRSVPSEVGLSIQGVWLIISLPALEWKTGRLQCQTPWRVVLPSRWDSVTPSCAISLVWKVLCSKKRLCHG